MKTQQPVVIPHNETTKKKKNQGNRKLLRKYVPSTNPFPCFTPFSTKRRMVRVREGEETHVFRPIIYKLIYTGSERQGSANRISLTQSTFPLALLPSSGALKSFMLGAPPSSPSRKCPSPPPVAPPRVRLSSRPLNHDAPASATPRMHPMVRNGCSAKVTRMSKKIFSKLEMVSLGLILGGDAVTLLSVSRIDVRDGMM